jgi:hypothetical protein
MTDRWLLPTMRSIFDADYQPPAGGGGRFYLLLGICPPASRGPRASPTTAAADGEHREPGELPACLRDGGRLSAPVGSRSRRPERELDGGAVPARVRPQRRRADQRPRPYRGHPGRGAGHAREETASRLASGAAAPARGTRASAATRRGGPRQRARHVGHRPSSGRGRPTAATARTRACSSSCASWRARRRPSTGAGRRSTSASSTRRSTGTIARGHRPHHLGARHRLRGLTDRQTLASVTAGLIAPASRTTCRATPRGTTPSVRVCRARSRRASRAARAAARAANTTLSAADGGHAALYLMGDGHAGSRWSSCRWRRRRASSG